jgi:hypothetical protein
VDLLVEHAAQAHRFDAEAIGLGTGVRIQMERRVRVAVDMAVQTGDAEALIFHLPVFGLVELLLLKGREL